MVSLGTILGLSAVSAIILGLVTFRTQIGEAGSQVGGGISDFGRGIQEAISAIFSPQIRPTFQPTFGLTTTGTLPFQPKSGLNPQCTVRGLFQSCPPNMVEHSIGGVSYCCPPGVAPFSSAVGPSLPTRPTTTPQFPTIPRGPALAFDAPGEQIILDRQGFRSDTFSIPIGSSTSDVASRLGFRDISDAGAARLRIRGGDLGFLTRAFQSGQATESDLRQGFRQAITSQ